MPARIYHLAIEAEWREAVAAGEYRRSTRGRSLNEVGFVHCSEAHQVRPTATRFYADVAEALVLLCIDPVLLPSPPVREPGGPDGELFPHVYGPIPLAAVVAVVPYDGGRSA